jgi:DNA polymerase III subunit delta'
MDWLVGHESTVELLRHSMSGERVSHAYLLTGPASIGKYTLALKFAQALNCTGASTFTGTEGQEDGRPCGQCRTCRLIGEHRHPDVRTIQMPEDKREISIDQVRQVLHEAALKPYEARWKVYVIRDAEAMSEEAANCLLKTLEEPPPQVVLLVVASTPEALLPTIVSRCRALPMHPLPSAQVEAALRENWACPADRAALLARLSGGAIGWAIQAAQDETVLAQHDRLVDRLAALGAASRVDRLAFAAEEAQRYTKGAVEREAVHAVLDLWATWWRDALLTKTGCPELVINVHREGALQDTARRCSAGQIRDFLEALSIADRQLRQNVNPRLAMEVLALAVPQGR